MAVERRFSASCIESRKLKSSWNLQARCQRQAPTRGPPRALPGQPSKTAHAHLLQTCRPQRQVASRVRADRAGVQRHCSWRGCD
eukprot:3884431-Rhodomonas_salina.1